MIDIKYERGTYVIDAKIHTEVATSDIAKVQSILSQVVHMNLQKNLKV